MCYNEPKFTYSYKSTTVSNSQKTPLENFSLSLHKLINWPIINYQYNDDEIRLFNDASISKMICVNSPDMYTVYIIAKDMIVVNIWS